MKPSAHQIAHRFGFTQIVRSVPWWRLWTIPVSALMLYLLFHHNRGVFFWLVAGLLGAGSVLQMTVDIVRIRRKIAQDKAALQAKFDAADMAMFGHKLRP